MSEAVRRMVRLLEEAVRRSGRSGSDLERAAGLAPGTLAALLGGRAELEVRHLLLLGRELSLDPLQVFAEGLQGEAAGGDDPVLAEVERAWREADPRRSGSPGARAAQAAADLDLEGAKELVRETIREELARLARGEAARPGEEREGGAGPAGAAPSED